MKALRLQPNNPQNNSKDINKKTMSLEVTENINWPRALHAFLKFSFTEKHKITHKALGIESCSTDPLT